MNIYLFRGLFGAIFSTGMDQLGEKLRELGHDAQVYKWINRKQVEKQILADGQKQPVVLIGHSLGGNSASWLATSLVEKGIPVAYVATIDPTDPNSAPPKPTITDNFLSWDPRGEKVKGATEFKYENLNHVEIDKDKSVHDRIISKIGEVSQAGYALGHIASSIPVSTQTGEVADVSVFETGTLELSDAAATQTSKVDIAANSELALGNLFLREGVSNDPITASIDATQQLTPINNWLGAGIGKLLNGKKTGLGVLGLLGVTILPELFSDLAPIQGFFKALGATSTELVGNPPPVEGSDKAVEVVETGKNLLTPIFTALTGWGLLGKIEKWTHLFKAR